MENNNYQNKRGSTFSRWLLSMSCVALCLFASTNATAQFAVTTNGGSGLAATYTDLASAITALNAATITSPVVITCPTGTETSPTGGYSITAQGTSTNTIIIQGNGSANSVITAPNPAGTSGALNDAIFKLVGADYVTITGFSMLENAANTTTAAGTNNMVEWGVALLYNGTTNGSQNNTISNNLIDLNRTYQNTFGIYANATHAAGTVTTSATATTTAGGNTGLIITGNSITDVNNGIVVVGPTAAADNNDGITIGGSAGNANTITNYGTTGTFSAYANVSGTVNGILVRNSKNFTISHNTVSSSNGGVTAGTLNGIQIPASTNAPTGTFTNSISNNSISLRAGAAGSAMNGINYPSGSASATSTLNVNSNDFNTFGHTVAGTAAITFITVTSTNQFTTINSNTFTNMSVNTTGSVTFISQSFTAPATGTKSVNSNSIVTGFTKTGAGGTVTFVTDNGSTVSGAVSNCQNNNFSNVTLTGATAITGINYTDGGTAPTRTVSGNTLSNWTTGAAAINAMNFTYWNGVSSLSSNTVTNLAGQGVITGITIGSTVNTATSVTIASNTVNNLVSSGTGGTVIGISCSNTSTLINLNNNTINTLSSTGASAVSGISISGASNTFAFSNKIYDLSGSNASSTVNGILVSAGTTVTLHNNIVGDLRATAANAANPLNGLNITGGTTVNAYYNTVYLNGSSSGALFGSSAISASTTPTLTLINNLFVNTSSTAGAGLAVAYRRSTATLTTYGASSNNNSFYSNATIFTDGATSDATLTAYKTRVSTRDAAAVSVNPAFTSTTGSNSGFLHINTATPTQLESGGVNIATYTTDFDGDTRNATTPDIGADEFSGIPLPTCSGTPAAGAITGASAVCSGLGTTLTLVGAEATLGATYQWASGTTLGGPYGTALGTGTTQATGTLTVPTYYQVTVTCANGGATSTTVEFAVNVNSLPTVAVSPTSASICMPGGSGVSLTASGASTYAWAPTSGLTPSTGATVSALPGSTTTYVVTGTDANGCIATASAVISIVATPSSVTATATPSSICVNTSSSLTATGFVQNTASVPSSYSFNGTAGTYSAITGTAVTFGAADDGYTGNLPIGFTFNYNGIAQTVFAVSPNGWVQPGQTGSATTGFFSNALASNANFIAALWDDNNITGGSAEYLTSGTAGSRILTVQWNNLHVAGSGSTTNPTINMQVKLYEETGAIQIIYGSTSAALSSPTASIGISGIVGNYLSVTPLSPVNTSTASSAAEFSVTSSTNFPSGTTYTFTPQSIALTYAWAPSGDVVSPSSQTTATNNLPATETFTVTVSNGGCSATATATVSIAGAMSVAVNSPTMCSGTPTALTAVPTGGATPITYAWTPATDLSATTGVTVNANPPSSTSYVVTATDACGTTASATSTVTVNPTPTATVSPAGPITVCSNALQTLTASTSGVSPTYQWALNGTPIGGATSSTYTPSASGSYTVVITDGPCSATSSAVVVTMNTAPSAVTVTPSTATICAGGSQTLTATGGTVPGILSNSITINLSNPATDEGLTCPGANTIASFTLPPIAGTVIGARLTITGVASASGSFQSEVNLNFSGTGINTNSLCFRGATGTTATPFNYVTGSNVAGDTATLAGLLNTAGGTVDIRYSDTYNDNVGGPDATFPATATLQYYYNGQVPGTITWSPTTTPSTGDVVSASPSSTTIYTATSTAANGCTASGTATVSVNANTASISGSTTTICPTETIVLTASGTGTITGYQWKLAGSPISGETAATYNATAPGSYTVDITADGCTVTSAAYVITATQYTITATAGANGSISPSGTVSVNCGDNQTFTFTPAGGYVVDVVTVDGSPVATAPSYTFTNVTANGHTIDVTFSVAPCLSPATANTGPNSSVCDGSNYTLVGTIGGSATSGTWSTSGTGTFSPSNVWGVATTYIPSPADLTAGSVVLTLTTDDPDGAGLCTAGTSSVTLTLGGTTPTTAATSSCSTLLAGRTSLLDANAVGGVSYQWSLNAVAIGGATSSTYTTLPVVTAGSSVYRVVVTGTGGCTASSSVTVTNVTTLPGGTYVIPGTGCAEFATIAASAVYMNTYGIGGAVTFNVAGGYTETAPAVSNGIVLSVTGTVTNTITYQKSGAGANPLVTAYGGGGQSAAGAFPNAIWSLLGSDYVTIDGIDLQESASNTTDATRMEMGYGLFKTSGTNGAQNNTIKNCTITLSRNNITGGSVAFGADGSTGIYSGNVVNTAATTVVTVTTADGTNSNNKFYGNTIQNVNNGIVLSGFAAATPFTNGDTGNDIGSVTGNTIINYGGGTTPAVAANGIRATNQWSIVVTGNTINSNNGSGVNHAQVLRGIFTESGTSANATITNNTVTVKGGGTTQAVTGIQNGIGTTAASNTVNITGNTVENCTYPTATTGTLTGIGNSATPATLNMNNNIVRNNVVGVNTTTNIGVFIGMTSTGVGTTGVNFVNQNNNTINNNTVLNQAGTLVGIRANTSTWVASGNTVSNLGVSATGGTSTSTITGITNASSPLSETITNNNVFNLSIAGAGTSTTHSILGIQSNTSSSSNKVISGNTIYTCSITNSSTGGGSITGMANQFGALTANIFKNKIYDLSAGGTVGAVTGISNTAGTTVNYFNNEIYDLRAPASTGSNAVNGITVSGGTTINVVFNTVSIAASSTGTTFGSSAMNITSTTPTTTLGNNIFINNSTPGSTSGLVVALRRTSTVLTSYGSASDRNIFYAGTPAANRLLYTDGTNLDQTITAMQSHVGTREVASGTENVVFVTLVPTDANFLVPSGVSIAESGGLNITGITDDYASVVRAGNPSYLGTGSAPDIGAREFEGSNPNSCTGTPTASAITSVPAVTTLCGPTSVSLSVVPVPTPGITYQWASSAVSGGPYTPIGGATAPTYIATISTTAYYVCVVTCSTSGLSSTTVERLVTINPIPTSVISPVTPVVFCSANPTPLTVSTSGVSPTYQWSLNGVAISGATTNTHTPLVSGSYTATVTDGGCAFTSTAVVVTRNLTPTTTASASSNTLCGAGLVDINATTASIPATPSAYAFSTSTATYVPLSSGTVSTAVGDDAFEASVPIGFSFPYNSTTFTTFGITSNGAIQMGSVAASQITNTLATVANIIGIMWEDNENVAGSIKYLTTGTAPNRVCTVDFDNQSIGGSGSSGNQVCDFQIRMYENGTIQFHYGNLVLNPTLSASIGLTGAVGNFISVTPGVTPTTSTTVANNTISSVADLPSGTIYTFTPPSASYAWTSSPASFTSSTQNNTGVSVSGTTTYTVVVTDNSTGCTSSSSTTVTVAAPLSVSLPATASTCTGQPTSITATAVGGGSPYTYTWYEQGNPVAISGQTSATLSVVPSTSPISYYVVVNDNCGGTATSSDVVVTTFGYPTVGASTSASGICVSGSVTLTATGGTTYSWTPAATLSASTGNPVTASPTASTIYTVTGTTNGCSSTATVSVTVGVAITGMTVSASPSNICSGATSQLLAVATSPIPAPVSSYTFSSSTATYVPLVGGTNSTASGDDGTEAAIPIGFSFPYNNTTVTSLIIGTNGFVGVGVAPGTNWVNALATKTNVIAPLWDDNHRSSGAISYLSSGIAPNRVFTIDWFDVSIGDAGTGLGSTLNPVCRYQVKLFENGTIQFLYGNLVPNSITASIGISGAAGSFLSVTPGVTATASNVTENAAITSVTDLPSGTVYTFTPPSQTLSYTWTPTTDLSNASIANPIAGPLTADATYTVVASNGGCTSSSSVTITVGTLPTVSLTSSPTAFCTGGTGSLVATVTGGGAPYSYEFSEGVSYSPSDPSNTISITPGSTTLYTVRVTDNCGNITSSTYNVVVNPYPTVAASSSATGYCVSGSVSLSATGATSFAWSPATNLSATTGTPVVATPTVTTIYTVTGTSNGCSSTATVTVNVGTPITSVSTTASPSNVCAPGTSQLNAIAIAPIPSTVVDYAFAATTGESLQDMTGSTQLQGSGLDVAASAVTNIGFSFSFNGTSYTQFSTSCNGVIGLGATAVTGADGNNSTTNPTIIPMWDDMHTCTNGQVHYVLNTSGGAGNYILVVEWQYGTFAERTGAFTRTMQAWLYQANGTIKFVYGANSGSALTSATTGIVGTGFNDVNTTTNTNTSVTAQNANTVWPAAGTAYTFTPPSSPITYSWSPSTDLSNPSIQNPVATNILGTTTYTVTATNAGGCTNTGTVTVTVAPLLATLSATPSTVCSNGSTTLTSTPSGGGSPYSYEFNDGVAYSPLQAGNTFVMNPTSSTLYTVRVSDACGNSATATVNVIVGANPTVTATGSAGGYCNTGSVTLTGGGAVTYVWSPNTDLSGTTTAVVTASPAATTTYTVVGTNADGCTASATVTVTVSTVAPPAPTVTNYSICTGGSIPFGEGLTAACGSTSTTVTNTYSFSNAPYSSVGTYPEVFVTVGTLTIPALPSGAVVQSAVLRLNGIEALGVSFLSDIEIGLTGDYLFGPGTISTTGGPGTIASIDIPMLGYSLTNAANLNFNYADFYDDGGINSTITSAQVILTYTVSSTSLNWYTASTGGTSIASTQVLDPIGLAGSGLANSNTPGSYLFYAECSNGFCASTRVPATLTIGAPLVVAPTSSLSSACTGTTITLNANASGGGEPYTYAWSTGGTTASVSTVITGNTTYTVTVSDACGNTQTSSVSVTTLPSPTVGATASVSAFCSVPAGGTSILTATGAVSYNWTPIGTLNNSTLDIVTATPTATTLYTVVGTAANSCTASATVNVTVGSPITALATATPSNICVGASSNLLATPGVPSSANVYSFAASTGATLQDMTAATSVIGSGNDDTPTAASAPIGFSFAFNGTVYTDYSVSPDGWIKLGTVAATSQFGNDMASTTNIPKLAACWDDLATGTDGNVKVLLTGTSPNQILVVQWFVTMPRVLAGPANSTFQAWLYEGSNKIEYRYGAMGVSGSASGGLTGGASNFQSITFSSNTVSTSTANNANAVSPTSGTMYTFNPPTAGPYTYSWSPSGSISGSSTIANPVTSALGTTTPYTVTITDAGGCTATATTTVTVGAPLVATASVTGLATFCQPGATTSSLTSTTTGGGTPYTYAWSDGTNPVGTATPAITVTAPIGTTIYTVTVTDACANATTATVSITANPVPTVSVSGGSTICGTGSVALTASGTSATYAWSPATGLSATTGASVTASPTTSTTYTVTGTLGSCTATAIAPVNVYPATTVTATADVTTGCSPLSTTLHAVGTSGFAASTYAFSTSSAPYVTLTGGTISTAVGDDVFQASVPIGFSFPYNGTTFTTFGITSNGAIQMGSVAASQITNSLATVANILGPMWEDNENVAGSISYLTTGIAPNRVCTVDFFNQSIGGSGSSNNQVCNFQIRMHENGVIEFHYGNLVLNPTLSASIGITGAVGNYISVTPAPTPTTSTSVPNNAIGSVADLPTGTIYTFTPPSLTYSWSPTTNMTGSTTADPTITALTSTETYTVTATGAGGCNATATVTLTVIPTVPAPTITSSAGTTICPSTSTTLDAGTGYTNYLWSPGGATTQTISVSPSSTTTYTVTVDNGPGSCSATSTLEITTYATTPASITPPGLFCTPGTATLNVTPTFSSYVWTPGGATTASLSITTGGTYSVVVTDANGCTQNPSITVTSNPTPPTATITYTGGLTVCDDDFVGFDLTADITGAAPGSTIQWFDENGTTGATFNVNAGTSDFDNIGNPFDVQFQVTTPAGCSAFSQIVSVERIVCTNNPITINVNAFIYGYYVGGQTMTPTIANELVVGATGAETDTITVLLYTWDGDGGTTPVLASDSAKGILMTDGSCTAVANAPDGSYYIAIRHRNSLLTFSSVALACSTATPVSYDFTSDITSAAFDNMRDLNDGFFAIYNGDFNQDQFIDGNDFTVFDLQSTLGDPEDYWTNDMNGDGFVDGNDFTPFDEISVLGLESIVHP